jgi:H+/Cl- antiporter ClcA
MSTIGNDMSNIKHEIVKNKFLIIAIILLIILFIIFITHLYFNIHAKYLSPNALKLLDGKENLFYKKLKYIIILVLFLIGLTLLYIFNPFPRSHSFNQYQLKLL